MYHTPLNLLQFPSASEHSVGTERIYSFYSSEHALKQVLAMSCSILSAKGAWIVRKDEIGNQMIAADSLAWEGPLSTVADVIVSRAEMNGPGQSGNVAMAEGQLYCSDLLTPCHADGVVYYFGILFEKKFRLSSFNRGLIDGFKCSLNALIPH
jgi:hypothetical protein